jgi:transcriptional regulator with XRE-family HTH domain
VGEMGLPGGPDSSGSGFDEAARVPVPWALLNRKEARMDQMGERIRAARQRAGLTLRQLALTTGVSASLLSQIENSRARPSVTTLYGLVGALGLSLDELLAPEPELAPPTTASPLDMDARLATLDASGGPVTQHVRHSGMRPVLEFESGVTWEQLTNSITPFVDHLLVTYPPSSSSSASSKLYTHFGFEHVYIIQGAIELQLEFDTCTLSAGDSIAFDCSRPLLFRNNSDTEPAVGVWFIIGRRYPAMLRQLTNGANEMSGPGA